MRLAMMVVRQGAQAELPAAAHGTRSSPVSRMQPWDGHNRLDTIRVVIKTVARAIGSRLAARLRRTLRGIDSLRRGGYHAAMTREQTPESRQGQRRHSPAGDGPPAVSSDDSSHLAPDAQVTSNGDQPAAAGRSRRVPSARVPNTEAPTL
ncbi:MAG: hypothetical protein ACRC1H_11195, partial [Caldilineaceae bacterium]